MTMEEELADVIQRKIWTAEEQLKATRDLANKANLLPKGAKKNIPVFTGDWSDDKIREFIERLKDSIINPLRHKNRKILEDIGITVKGIPEDIFDDSNGIEKINSHFASLKEVGESILDILIRNEILYGWLKEGTDNTIENLQEILNAKTAFQRILDSDIDEGIKDELLRRSITDRDFIQDAENTISQIKCVLSVSLRGREPAA
jgi:hypothetical protein